MLLNESGKNGRLAYSQLTEVSYSQLVATCCNNLTQIPDLWEAMAYCNLLLKHERDLL